MVGLIKGFLGKHVTGILVAVLALSVVGNGLLIKAWRSELTKHAAAVASCNADKEGIRADTERETRKTVQAVFNKRMAQRDKMDAELKQAIKISEAEKASILAGQEVLEVRVHQLELEAEKDEVPDSRACLNAFILNESLDGVCVRAGGSSTNEGGTGAGSCAVARDTEGPVDGISVGGDFSPITYGDLLILFDSAQRTNALHNVDKQAIRALQERTE